MRSRDYKLKGGFGGCSNRKLPKGDTETEKS